ncbi:hypothetical protein P154DRAFT_110996 [Amniculicola lignicola CBS 123094]|uniref:Uncharacterized protein n=1 Tax=Amniculicola lignicola CBS 123094 TaxID=1392246 RepID=A0A6A5WMA3_9PLEO|nr:hypothetical protein P154DRAFT_110996 [Amniculicola lignicola CBS 123094]
MRKMDSAGAIAAIVLCALFGGGLLWIGLFFFHKWIQEQCRKFMRFLKDVEEYAKHKALRREREKKATPTSPERAGRGRHRSSSRRYPERGRDHSLEKGPLTPPPQTYPARRNYQQQTESSVSQSSVARARPFLGRSAYPRARGFTKPGAAVQGPNLWTGGDNLLQTSYPLNRMNGSQNLRPYLNAYHNPYAAYTSQPEVAGFQPLQMPMGDTLGYEQYIEEQPESATSKAEDKGSDSHTEIVRSRKPEIINYRMPVDELPAFILEAQSRLGLRSETEATVDGDEIQQIPRAYIPRSAPWVPPGPLLKENWELPLTSVRTTKPWIGENGGNRYAPYEKSNAPKRKFRSADRRRPLAPSNAPSVIFDPL